MYIFLKSVQIFVHALLFLRGVAEFVPAPPAPLSGGFFIACPQGTMNNNGSLIFTESNSVKLLSFDC